MPYDWALNIAAPRGKVEWLEVVRSVDGVRGLGPAAGRGERTLVEGDVVRVVGRDGGTVRFVTVDGRGEGSAPTSAFRAHRPAS